MWYLWHEKVFTCTSGRLQEFKDNSVPWLCLCPVETGNTKRYSKAQLEHLMHPHRFLLTLDLYHSSASWRFLAATLSYCWRTSRRAAVRSGLETSISIWMCCSWSWACSSRISLERSRHSVLLHHIQNVHRWGLSQNQQRAYMLTRLSASNHKPHYSAYLIMKLLQEDNLLLQGLNLALKIKTCQRGIVNILNREKND